MSKNKTFKTTLKMIECMISTSSNINDVEENKRKMTIFLRIIYTGIILFIYLTSLSSILITNDVRFEKDWIKSLININQSLVIFVATIDFVLWWIISLNVDGKRKYIKFFTFPFRFMGILLILILIPSIQELAINFGYDNKSLEFIRYFAFLRAIRLTMLLGFFSPFRALFNVFEKERWVLTYTFIFILFVIFLFSTIFYNLETDKTTKIFMPKEGQTEIDGNQFFKAIYFTTVTMTTIGYGDYAPTTQIGRLMVIILSLIGIAIFAIPSGVIAGGFITELKHQIAQKKLINHHSIDPEEDKEVKKHD
ncbi:potassium channel family protein [Mycoplasma sp. Mirounga ES2805-ORL]|uniref:potassium channel family protein n=1 Tax=Mycoplasma sp. Mirounga ES2805-ORL TaxID=754514 RepID=UPI00197B2EF8|nr:potassium channel family protein [Mycoplasma sp. Mirounga ES2805-ORL]QSF13642.1 potassium channel family protein [Mycoplasma sp. Mirounga ES2805-ORL]